MRTLLQFVVTLLIVTPASAQSLQVVGYAGALGEWELTATVTEAPRLWSKEFSGSLSMKHVGICSQDGPEERTGEIRFQISGLSSRLNATLRIDGLVCTYSAGSPAPYSGMMTCPDREAVPLKLWLR
jgi:hypothetical protein